MKILATADLHFPGESDTIGYVEEALKCRKPDVLVIAGDLVNGGHLRYYDSTLARFDFFKGPKLIVPGNHDIATNPKDNFSSGQKYERILPTIAEAHGFRYLDQGPAVIDNVGFVGTMGWYDYSLRCTADLDNVRPVIGDTELSFKDLGPENYKGGSMRIKDHGEVHCHEWFDQKRINLPYRDEEFVDAKVKALEDHLKEIDGKCDNIVAVMHMIPFRELLPQYPTSGSIAFGNAYMGSTRFGEVLASNPKVGLLIAGHSHIPRREYVQGIECHVIGKTEAAFREIMVPAQQQHSHQPGPSYTGQQVNG